MSEIPLIGRLFKGKRRPDPPIWEEDDPAFEIETQAPRVSRQVVLEKISSSIGAPPVGEGELGEATPSLLEGLLKDPLTRSQGSKFLREGEKIVIGGVNAHVAYARAAKMVPEDAGLIETALNNDPQVLVIKGGSVGLGIPDKNANRPETMRLLRKIAPNIDFKED